MVSRRNYFTIMVLMVVIFFLCMTIDTLKDTWNDYEVNPYSETAENYPSKVNIYVPEGVRGGGTVGKKAAGKTAGKENAGIGAVMRSKVIGIGDPEGTLLKMATEWVTYTKRDISLYKNPSAYQKAAGDKDLPEMLVIDSGSVDWSKTKEVKFLKECADRGIHLIFCNLPEASVIRENTQARELLGIQEVRKIKETVDGFHLYGGFLLGGEIYYQALEEEEEKYQDMELTLPWYRLSSGTKVYMKGILEDESVKPEEHPPVIWRKSFGSACVFAVNGGYMEGMTGIGLLSAMSAEIYPYEIYPAVNAQSMVFESYPSLADENQKKMDEVYSRSLKQVLQEIVWPYVDKSLMDYQYGITCMLTPQYDYRDKNEPDEEQLEYYLKIFHEQAAEVGFSAANVSDLSVREKILKDEEFFSDAMGSYDFTSFYAGGLTDEETKEALNTKLLSSVKTVVKDYEKEDTRIVGLITEDVTQQSVLGDGLGYTFTNDLLMRSVQTAIGYTNVAYDMMRAAYPKSGRDSWEKLSKDFAKSVDVCGQTFDKFDQATLTECDTHIRRFLALDYTDSRAGDAIRLKTEGAQGTSWFILRTHNEEVDSVDGGSFRKLEDGAYLIEAEDGEAVIWLQPADKRYYTMPQGSRIGQGGESK